MPLTVAEGALLGTGMLLVSGATLAYKRKQTAAFKALYFLSWPTLGSALLWTCMPSKERMEQRMGLDAQQLEAHRAATQAQMAQLRQAAADGKR